MKFKKHKAITGDGFTQWVNPVANGYLMKCCGCGLVHEMDTRVVRYEPLPSEDFTVSDDQNDAVQFRMRRRDDIRSS